MAILTNLMGTGVPGGTAIAINGKSAVDQAATGATQGAQPIEAEIVAYATSTVSCGPTLPAGNAGDTYFIGNNTANTISVWPPVGGVIQAGAVNAADTILTARSAIYICLGGLNYIHTQGAAA
jgi:hypothetical protein